MRKSRVIITLSCCLVAMAVLAWAQSNRKPGLYETTSTMTWQQSPMPAGMPAPPNSPFGGGPRTTQSCVTQDQIDKYGGPIAQSRGDCQITNINKKANGMTADMVCSGKMSGKATIESTWSEDGHSKSHTHFLGEMQLGPNTKPIEWTTEATSTYKGPDCGDVKPVVIPTK